MAARQPDGPEKTSDNTIAKVVAWASKMGKTPIVVNDCPGFFVNRVLFPYFAGFSQLLRDGADFRKVDKVMEKQFGWPMGPAYLLDVVGIDMASLKNPKLVLSLFVTTLIIQVATGSIAPILTLYVRERFSSYPGSCRP